MAGAAGSRDATGGMLTKIQAAKIALGAGCHMVIARGTVDHPIAAIERGGRCSWFISKASPRAARKNWIAGTLKPKGRFMVDGGALKALANGKSLLPAGVIEVQGRFERGDAVIVENAQGLEVARGLTAYSGADARRIMGHKSREIQRILGYRGRDEMIHRDDLVLT